MAYSVDMYKNADIQTRLESRLKEGFDLIQVILGPRQVGKTTAILNALNSYPGESFYISAEKELSPTPDWIHEIWQTATSKSPDCLLVIDEIQKVPNWSEQIKSLWDAQSRMKKTQLRLVLLGSSSVKIQQGLTESLTGRFELIRAYHWSLAETQFLKKMDLETYLKFGGYPGTYKMISNQSRFEDYLQNSIIGTVIEKDLLTQGRVRNTGLFKQTFSVLQGLPATEISYTKLLGQLQDRGNTDLIKNYLDLYEGAFLFTQIYKYHGKSFKSRLSTPKIISMAPALLDLSDKDTPEFLGRCFESLVGADLIRAGLSLHYWRDGDYEIDFVTKYKRHVVGIEVKSQKRKSSKSVAEFKKAVPGALVLYINFENYQKFAKDPIKYLTDQIGP